MLGHVQTMFSHLSFPDSMIPNEYRPDAKRFDACIKKLGIWPKFVWDHRGRKGKVGKHCLDVSQHCPAEPSMKDYGAFANLVAIASPLASAGFTIFKIENGPIV